MANYDNEQKGMDLAASDQHLGSVLQTLGWVLLAFDAIPAVWIWVGLRIGSLFWLYWVIGEAVVGFGFLAAGALYRAKAAGDFARLDTDVISAAPTAQQHAQQADRRQEPPEQVA